VKERMKHGVQAIAMIIASLAFMAAVVWLLPML
jgi:hypothetical protein